MLSLKRVTTDEEFESANSVLVNDELFDRIAEDGHEPSDHKPYEKDCYLLIKNDEVVIGVWFLEPENSTTLNIHCNILKEHRAHGKEAGKLILKWFVEDAPEQYQKLNAEIPFTYPEVYHYTKKYGFKNEGVNRLSVMKKGELVDQWRLGITRTEIKEGENCQK